MKRTLLLSFALIFALCGVVYAAGVNGDYKGFPIVKVQYEGKEIKGTIPGFLFEGNTMVPLGLLRQIGLNVEWDQATLTANITKEKPAAGDKTPLTSEQIKQLGNAVALIYSLDSSGNRTAQGSGFILNSRGLLVTAYHVAEEDGQLRDLEVILNGKTYRVPKGVYVFADKEKDIFGVYLQDPGPLPYLKVGELPKEKDKVYALGYPDGIYTVYSGKMDFAVNHLSRTIDSSKPQDGTSGGPQLNVYGEVTGVVIGGDKYVGISTWITEVEIGYLGSIDQ